MNDEKDKGLNPEESEEKKEKKEKPGIDDVAKSLGGEDSKGSENSEDINIPGLEELGAEIAEDKSEEKKIPDEPAEFSISEDDKPLEIDSVHETGDEDKEQKPETEVSEDERIELPPQSDEPFDISSDPESAPEPESDQLNINEDSHEDSMGDDEDDALSGLDEIDLSGISFDEEEDAEEEEPEPEPQREEINDEDFAIKPGDSDNIQSDTEDETAEDLIAGDGDIPSPLEEEFDVSQEIPDGEIDLDGSPLDDIPSPDGDIDEPGEGPPLSETPVNEQEAAEEPAAEESDEDEAAAEEDEVSSEESDEKKVKQKKKKTKKPSGKKSKLPLLLLLLLIAGGAFYYFNNMASIETTPPARVPARNLAVAPAQKAEAQTPPASPFVFPESQDIQKDVSDGIATYVYDTSADFETVRKFYRDKFAAMGYSLSTDDYSQDKSFSYMLFEKDKKYSIVIRKRQDRVSALVSYAD